MWRAVVIIAAATVVCIPLGCGRRNSASGNSPAALAAHVVDAGVEALGGPDDGGPSWQELEKRLEKLYSNPSKEADEAIVILMSFYLGEHNGEELYENLLSRGPRMIPLLEHYLPDEPASLLGQYPKRVRLERKTTVMFLKEALAILRVQAGARRVSGVSVETAPLREQAGNCKVKLVKRPELKFHDNLIQPGESYKGGPLLQMDIEESGDTTNVLLLQPSGIQELDMLLLADVRRWKYAPRPDCGVVQSNIAMTVDWMAAN